MVFRKAIVESVETERADAIFRAVSNQLAKMGIEIDAVIDVFDDGTEKGEILKIYEIYKPEIDICIWVYVPKSKLTNNEMIVLSGLHKDCTTKNLWRSGVTRKSFSNNRAIKLHREVRDYVIDIIISYLNKFYDVGKVDDENE